MTEPSGATVVVDINEPDLLRMLSLNHPDVTAWREDTLDAADLVVNGVGFERKTPNDFVGSMTEGRLREQAEKLTAYDHAYVLLEAGSFADFEELEHTGVSAASARGMAARLTAQGLPVIPTGGPPNTERGHRMLVDYAIRQGRKHTEDPSDSYIPTGPVGIEEPTLKRWYGCLDDIGPGRADDLYAALPTLTAFLNAEVQDLVAIDGFGEITAESVLSQRDAILQGADSDD